MLISNCYRSLDKEKICAKVRTHRISRLRPWAWKTNVLGCCSCIAESEVEHQHLWVEHRAKFWCDRDRKASMFLSETEYLNWKGEGAVKSSLGVGEFIYLQTGCHFKEPPSV